MKYLEKALKIIKFNLTTVSLSASKGKGAIFHRV